MKKRNSKARNNRSTAKGTEAKFIEHMNKIEQRFGKEFEQVQYTLRAMRRDLITEIMGVDGRLMCVERQLTDFNTRLTDKIDSIHVRLDDHEVRIATMEAPAKP